MGTRITKAACSNSEIDERLGDARYCRAVIGFHEITNLIKYRGPDDEGYLLVKTETNRFTVAGGPDTPSQLYHTIFPYSPSLNIDEVRGDSFNLALSNRRLSILDATIAGHQPLSNEDQTLWIVHNGEVYNYKELRQELESLVHVGVNN